MKVTKKKGSPYWCVRIHTGYDPKTGYKKFSRLSTKIPLESPKKDAESVGVAMQAEANKQMAIGAELITERQALSIARSLCAALGIKIVNDSPRWSEFAHKALNVILDGKSEATIAAYKAGHNMFTDFLKGDPRIDEIAVADIQEWYDSLIDERGNSPNTAKKSLLPVSMIFKIALKQELISRNPCDNIYKRKVATQHTPPFELSEVRAISQALVDHADEIEFVNEWQIAITLAILTGQRRGDCFGLNKSMISDDGKIVTYIEGKKSVRHARGEVDGTISFYLHPTLQNMLRHAETDSEGYFCPNLRTLPRGLNSSGKRFKDILKLAGVAPKVIQAFHRFRAFFKTQLESDGVSREINNRLTGHKDEEVGANYIQPKVEATYEATKATQDRLASIMER